MKKTSLVSRVLHKAAEAIYPTYLYCFCCGSIIDSSRKYGLCDSCVEKFRWAVGKTCEKCGKPMGEKDRNAICCDCQQREHYFEKGFTCAGYGLYERIFVSQFKKHGKSYMKEAFGRILHDRIVIENIVFDVIIPIPIHKEKLKERGYNQALLMAKALSKFTGVKTDGKTVIRTVKTLPNKKLGAWERFENMKGAFQIAEGREKQIINKNILLVDDIYTTGATVDICSKLLLEKGAAKVYVLTFAAGVSSSGKNTENA